MDTELSSSSSSSVSVSPTVPIIGKNSYKDWLLSQHIHIHPSLVIEHNTTEGYHITTKYAIPAGTLLIDVPFSACCLLQQNDSFVNKLLHQGIPGLYIASLLYLTTSFSTQLGPHYLLLQSLTNITNILDWTFQEKDILHGTTQESAVGTLPVRERFRELIIPIIQQHPEKWNKNLLTTSSSSSSSSIGTSLTNTTTTISSSSSSSNSIPNPSIRNNTSHLPYTTTELQIFENYFVHACHIFLSRGFHSEGSQNASHSSFQTSSSSSSSSLSNTNNETTNTTLTIELFDGPHLVPFADLLNHHPLYACTQLARVGNNFRYYSLRDISNNEQIYASYGNLSDGQLLHTYGFTLPVAKHIPIVSTTKSIDEYSEYKKLLHKIASNNTNTTSSSTLSSSSTEDIPSNYHFTNNPANNFIIPTKLVLNTIKTITMLSNHNNPKYQKIYDKTVTFLRQKGLLPPDGFSFQRSTQYLRSLLQPPSTDEIMHIYQTIASELVPKNLATVIQVLLQDIEGMKSYMEAYEDNNDNNILYLPLNPASSKHKVLLQQTKVVESTSSSGVPDSDEEDDDDDPEMNMQCWSLLMMILQQHLRTSYHTTIENDYVWWLTINNPEYEELYYKTIKSSTKPSFMKNKGDNIFAKKRKREEEVPNETSSSSSSSSSTIETTSSNNTPLDINNGKIELGKHNYRYQSCRLIGMGEKEFIIDIITDIMDDLNAAEEEYEDILGDDDNDDEDDEDEDDEDEDE